MPRRPRPRSRAPDDIHQPIVSDEDETRLDSRETSDDDALTDSAVEDDEEDVDAPRIVQWADEDDLKDDDQRSSDEQSAPGPSNLVSIMERILRLS